MPHNLRDTLQRVVLGFILIAASTNLLYSTRDVLLADPTEIPQQSVAMLLGLCLLFCGVGLALSPLMTDRLYVFLDVAGVIGTGIGLAFSLMQTNSLLNQRSSVVAHHNLQHTYIRIDWELRQALSARCSNDFSAFCEALRLTELHVALGPPGVPLPEKVAIICHAVAAPNINSPPSSDEYLNSACLDINHLRQNAVIAPDWSDLDEIERNREQIMGMSIVAVFFGLSTIRSFVKLPRKGHSD